MKKSLVLLLVSIMATSALAAVDPDPDMLGVYFDPAAIINESAATPNVPFNAYIILTNPTSPVSGLECSYDIVSTVAGTMFRLSQALPTGSIDLGVSTNIYSGDFYFGLANPLAPTEAVVLVSWTFLILTPQSLEFYLSEFPIPSLDNGLPAYEAGGTIKPLGLSTGGPDIPVAVVNGLTPVATENASFGNVKALFR